MKSLLSATAIALFVATPAFAQQSATDPAKPPAADRSMSAPAKSDAGAAATTTGTQPTTASTSQKPGQINADKLIGQDIENPEGDDIGEIKSVILNQDGSVDSVIVGVGGFLGLGEREVAIKWSDLKVQDNGETIVASFTKDQLKAMPEYEYADEQQRGRTFTRDGARTTAGADARPTTAAPAVAPPPGATASVEQNEAVNALGQMSADQIIGQNVVNAQGENIGEVEDLVIDKDKEVFAVISVGGFLGMGDKDVAIPFDKLRMNERNAILMSEANEDQLKQLPAFKKTDTWRPVERDRPVLDR
jgi:sporulation protein YlmC with PRC-barrel domain